MHQPNAVEHCDSDLRRDQTADRSTGCQRNDQCQKTRRSLLLSRSAYCAPKSGILKVARVRSREPLVDDPRLMPERSKLVGQEGLR